MVNVQDPLNPTFEGCFGGDGYVHDAQCLIYRGPDTAYYGRELCFCYNEDDLTILDVDDKANMMIISRTGYNGSMYTHQVKFKANLSVVHAAISHVPLYYHIILGDQSGIITNKIRCWTSHNHQEQIHVFFLLY